MKILVLSDTHHDLEKAKRILETGTFDALWHLGDNKSDADNLADIFGIETISVMGNCDGVCGNSDYFKIVDLPFGKFYLTHGHVEGVNFDFTRLYMSALEHGCKCAFFGHTHKVFDEDFNSVRLINPGSLSLPRDGAIGTFAVIDADEEDFSITVKNWEEVLRGDFSEAKKTIQESNLEKTSSRQRDEKKVVKKSAKGGYLRKIMNYSDGQ